MRRTWRHVLALAAALAMLGTACGEDGPDTAAGSSTSLRGVVTVSAASSLTGPFTQIADAFMDANPDVDVRLNFDSSSTLATQVLEGAPVDVFASADEANLARLADEDHLVGEAQIFARSELVIITKPGNPAGVRSLADLVDVGVISLCGEAVPCGRYAAEVLAADGVTIPESSITRGQNASATLTAVAEGDAVAGVVYVTDALAAGSSVASVAIPEAVNVIAAYPIAVLSRQGDRSIAAAFVEHVLGAEGQRVLSDHGFLPPS